MQTPLTIPASELEITAVTSPGPGGQNVNKTATKVKLRWHVLSSKRFSEVDKQRLLHLLSDRITQEGYLIMDVSETRSQLQNKQIAIERLQELVRNALQPVIPRKATKTPKRVKLQRLHSKRKRSNVKDLRKPVAED